MTGVVPGSGWDRRRSLPLSRGHRRPVDNVMFEGDHKHSDNNVPATRKTLAEALRDVPDDKTRKIADDARRVFKFPRRSGGA
jgi:hypothetical protein